MIIDRNFAMMRCPEFSIDIENRSHVFFADFRLLMVLMRKSLFHCVVGLCRILGNSTKLVIVKNLSGSICSFCHYMYCFLSRSRAAFFSEAPECRTDPN